MKVLHLAKGRKYYVWAMCDDDDSCQVLETLKAVNMEHPDLVETITAILYEVVPDEGPPLDGYRAKMLHRDILYELKADKDVTRRKHVGLRIAFFFDDFSDGPVVVCTNAFCKHGSSTPETDLDTVLVLRARYFEEKDELEFVTEVPT